MKAAKYCLLLLTSLTLYSCDRDGDGVGDNADAFPEDSTETADSDKDGVGDNGDISPNLHSLAYKYEDIIRAMKKSSYQVLKDPKSSTYRNLRILRYLEENLTEKQILEGMSYPRVCGEVNSKNSYGGYTGYQLMSYSLLKNEFKLKSDRDDEYGELFYNLDCRGDEVKFYEEDPTELNNTY